MNIEKLFRHLILFFFVLLAGCGSEYELEDYTKVEVDRSLLVLGLSSYMSLSDVERELSIEPGVIVITDKNISPKQDGIPPFDILTAKIPDVEIKNFKGSVLMTFFNGRLMEVRFFPVDVNGFVQTIDGLPKSKEIEIRLFTKVWFGQDYQDKAYVGWLDIRLQKQFDAWIKNYS
jgi:hypothetical protein